MAQGYLNKSPFSFETKPGQGDFYFGLVFITTRLKIFVSVGLVIDSTNIVCMAILLSTNFMDYWEEVVIANPVEKLTQKLFAFSNL